jgi:hypothetical protein
MTKFNTVTILSITAALTFAGNAIADDNITPSVNNNAYAFSIGNSGNATPFTALSDGVVLSIPEIKLRNPGSDVNFTYGFYVYEDGSIPADPSKFIQIGTVTEDTLNDPGLAEKIESKKDTFYSITSSWSEKFDKDQLVGFWIEEEGQRYLTDNTVGKDLGLITSTDNGHSEGHDAYLTTGKNKTKYEITIFFDGSHENVELSGIDGGPLPGVWATIALAGAASAYLRRRRKGNK